MSEGPVSVILAAPILDTILQKMYPAFSADPGRFRVVSIASNWEDLQRNVKTIPAEALVVEADIAESPQRLAEWLAAIPGVAVVVLPPAWAQAEGAIRSVDKVREVFIGPHVNYMEIAGKVYSAAVTARALRQQVAPLEGLYRPTAPGVTRVVGLRVFAFYSSKGGPGKTTLAVNFAYELSRLGVRTLIMGFDTPDDVGVQLMLPRSPNSSEFYNRPSVEGFQASLQRKDNLDVMLSPNDFVTAARVAQRAPEEPGSIRSLIQMAWTMGYGAIVLDLPPTEETFALQPLLLANTLVFVALPSYSDMVKLVQTCKLLTETLAGQHRIPPENMYVVLNQVTPKDNLLPDAFHQASANYLGGWFPPVIASIPYDPMVRSLQNEGKLAVVYLDDFGRAVRGLVHTFYQNLFEEGQVKPRRSFSLGRLKIKVR